MVASQELRLNINSSTIVAGQGKIFYGEHPTNEQVVLAQDELKKWWIHRGEAYSEEQQLSEGDRLGPLVTMLDLVSVKRKWRSFGIWRDIATGDFDVVSALRRRGGKDSVIDVQPIWVREGISLIGVNLDQNI